MCTILNYSDSLIFLDSAQAIPPVEVDAGCEMELSTTV